VGEAGTLRLKLAKHSDTKLWVMVRQIALFSKKFIFGGNEPVGNEVG
jgi:hypothetical protein